MIWLLAHVAAYGASGYTTARAVSCVVRRRQQKSHRACLERITKLEVELGLGIDWALDQLDSFVPAVSKRKIEGYSSLYETVFRCYGCELIVPFKDYSGRTLSGVTDKSHILCNACMRSRVHA